MRTAGQRAHAVSWLGERLGAALHQESGSVVLESALVLMMVLTLIFGLVEFCILSYSLTVLSGAAKQGVRYAISHGTDSNVCSGPGCADSVGANVISAINAYVGSYLRSTPSISAHISYPDNSSSPPSRVVVSIDYAFQPMLNFPGMSHTFSLSSEGRIVY